MRVAACEMFRLLFQVEDVDKKFVDLDKLKSADWVMTRQSPVKPKRVVVSTDFGFHSIFLCACFHIVQGGQITFLVDLLKSGPLKCVAVEKSNECCLLISVHLQY